MTLVQTNRASFTSAEAITSATQTTLTRTSAADGLPGDSNGPASGEYAVVFTDGTNFEIAYVTGGQGTTALTLQRAAELIGGVQTALSSVASGTQFFAVATAASSGAGPSIASYDTTVLTKLSLAPIGYWKLNDPVGSTTAADSSGNGYTLTVNGTVTFGEASVVPSDSETSAQGDGSTGYLITSSAPAKLPVGSSPFTWLVAATVSESAIASPGPGLMSLGGQSNATALGWPGGMGGASGNEYGIWSNNNNSGCRLSAVGNHLFGLTYDGYTASVWLDGHPAQMIDGGNWNGQTTFGTVAGNVTLLAGNGSGLFNFSNFPVGRAAIFAGVLTPKDWALLMQAFTGV